MSKNFIKVEDDYLSLVEIRGINYAHILLLCKIKSLSNNDNKSCTASNAYFSDLLHTSERNIQLMLNVLKINELIKTFEKRVRCKTTTRYIYPQINIINSIIYKDEELKELIFDNETTRINVLEDTNDSVISHEDNCLITRRNIHPNKRIKDNNKENKIEGADALDYGANAPNELTQITYTQKE